MWIRNGNKLNLTSDSRRMIKPDGSLFFSEIIHHKTQKPDEGTYQCEAFSHISDLDYQIVSKTASLIVAGKSLFSRLGYITQFASYLAELHFIYFISEQAL